MKTRSTIVVLAATLLNAACIDFVEPVFPTSGPTIFSASVHLLATGAASVQGHLVPGMNEQRVWRAVSPDTLRVNGVRITSSNVRADQQRDYTGDIMVDAVSTGLISIQPPGVAGVAPPALVQLPIVQRADPDTVRFALSLPFALHVRVPPSFAVDSAAVPRSWLVEITDGKKAFRLGADGAPPATITVPIEYQPLDQPGTSTATLFVFETRKVVQPAGDYIAVYSLDSRVRWTVQTVIK